VIHSHASCSEGKAIQMVSASPYNLQFKTRLPKLFSFCTGIRATSSWIQHLPTGIFHGGGALKIIAMNFKITPKQPLSFQESNSIFLIRLYSKNTSCTGALIHLNWMLWSCQHHAGGYSSPSQPNPEEPAFNIAHFSGYPYTLVSANTKAVVAWDVVWILIFPCLLRGR
jgi:hypothetical protein